MKESLESWFQNFIAGRLIKNTENEISEILKMNKKEGKKIEEINNSQNEQSKNNRLAKIKQQEIINPDFVRIEKNIASFGFFTPSSKRIENKAKIIKFSQTVDGNRVEAQVKISGNVEYGMPITADQDKYIAFQKILERVMHEKGKIENPISFTTHELISLLGLSKHGKIYKDVEEWLKVMNTTFIESEGAIWIAGKRKFASDSFVIFQRVKRTGQELDDGSLADRNYVWLSDWYLENLKSFFTLPIEFETYKLLKNHTSKALVPLLQIWLYASREQGNFEKRYSEICQTLNITEYKKQSDIKRKFGKSLDELVDFGYLSSWSLDKTADKKDFKIIFKHGFKFYGDRKKIKQGNRKSKNIENSPILNEKSPEAVILPFNENNSLEAQNFDPSEVSEVNLNPNNTTKAENDDFESKISLFSDEVKSVFKLLKNDFDISFEKSLELITNNFDETKKQIEIFSYRDISSSIQNKSGFLISAIEKKYPPPSNFIETKNKKLMDAEREAEEKRIEEESEKFLAEQRILIDACSFCDENGRRTIKDKHNSMYQFLRLCSHDSAEEYLYEDWK